MFAKVLSNKIFEFPTFYTHITDLQTTFAPKLLSKLDIESDKFSAQSSMRLLWMVSPKNDRLGLKRSKTPPVFLSD